MVTSVIMAHRIVTLAPNLTEIAFAAGAGDQLVGVSAFSDYPAAAKKLPIVSDYQSVDFERLLSLKPDMVLAWEYTNPRMIAHLKRLHIPIETFSFATLQDIPHAIERIGVLSGTDAVANKQASIFEKQVAAIRKLYANRKPVKVFYQLSEHPLMTINHKSLISQAIEICGGRNVFDDALSLAPVVSIESVLKTNPDVIIISQNQDGKSDAAFWRQYPSIRAVKHHKIYVIPAALIERPGPRMIEGIKEACQRLDTVRKLKTKIEPLLNYAGSVVGRAYFVARVNRSKIADHSGVVGGVSITISSKFF